MHNSKHNLKFMWDDEQETVFIHSNKEGLEYLRNKIDALLKLNSPDDIDMMVPEWGGEGLSSVEIQKNKHTIHLAKRVKICNW